MATLMTAVSVEREVGEESEPRPARVGVASERRLARVSINAECPLCGTHILSIGRGGRVTAEDLHPVPLHRGGRSEGYMLCDECGVLAELPSDLTLN